MKVAIYARVSRADKDDPNSIPVQLADCREHAEDQGWEVVAEFVDEGISAYNVKKTRPGFEDLLEFMRARGAEVILVREIERLLRQDKDGARILELYASAGFRLIASVLESDIDLSRARDRKDFKERVAGAVFYSERLSEKIRRTTSRKAERGEWSGGGRRPFGYRVVGPKPFRLEVDPAEAGLLSDAASHVLAGGSLYSVTKLWNDGRAPKDSGSRWTPTDVRRILMSEQVAGMRGGVRGTWDPIVGIDDHLALSALLRDSQRRPSAEKTGQRWPLAGLCVCGRVGPNGPCGVKLQGKSQARSPGDTRRMYVCSGRAGGCASLGITAPDLERHLISLALELPEPLPLAQYVPDEVRAKLLRQLRELEDRKRNLGLAFASGDMTAPQVRAATEVMDEEIASLQESLPPVDGPRRHRYAKSIGDFWDFIEGRTKELPEEDREPVNAWLRSVIREVRVNPARARGIRFDASRVEVTLLDS